MKDILYADIAIVGAGASGLAAAISAAQMRGDLKIVLLEQAARVGQKLLATGNGRCNLSNDSIAAKNYNLSATRYKSVFKKYGDDRQFFSSLGLMLRADSQGRVYPYSMQAASVLNCLRTKAAALGVEELCGFSLQNIGKDDGGFVLTSEGGQRLAAKRVLLCCGSPAGGGRDNEKLISCLKKLGEETTPFKPALAALTSDSRSLKALKGARLIADVSIFGGGELLGSESGEVQFGDGYIGGICVMNLCRKAAEQGGKLVLSIDAAPDFCEQDIYEHLKLASQLSSGSAAEIFSGLLSKNVDAEIMRGAVENAFARPASSLTEREIRAAARAVKNWRFDITGAVSNKKAQVCSGGVKNVDPDTLESKKVKGLYYCGELLDVYGDCGGYNLHWAWASGRCAGEAAAKSI